jgi:hypothetical protein
MAIDKIRHLQNKFFISPGAKNIRSADKNSTQATHQFRGWPLPHGPRLPVDPAQHGVYEFGASVSFPRLRPFPFPFPRPRPRPCFPLRVTDMLDQREENKVPDTGFDGGLFLFLVEAVDFFGVVGGRRNISGVLGCSRIIHVVVIPCI